MNPRILLSALPLLVVSGPAFAQAPAAPAPAAAPPAADPPLAPAPAAPAQAAPLPEPAAAAPGLATAPAGLPMDAAEEQKAEAEPQPADRVIVGKTGFFQPSATLQLWAFAAHVNDEWTSTFRARRAELRIKGEIVPKTIGYFVMIDPARALEFERSSLEVQSEDPEAPSAGSVTALQPPRGGSTSILQDVAVTFLSEYADVSLGQFKNPVSLEGAGSASKLLFPERSLVARRFGDRRDLGIKAEKKFDQFGYTLGVFNGEGQNRLDSNDQKDVALRLEVYPLEGVTAALVGYTAIGDREEPGTKDRIEGDLKIEKYNALLQAEYIRGWDMGSSERIEGQGFYVVAGYTFFDKLQPIARIGSLDPEIGEDEYGSTEPDPNDETTHYEFGVNYYIKGHDAKLQLAGAFFDPEQRISPTRFELTLAAQVAF